MTTTHGPRTRCGSTQLDGGEIKAAGSGLSGLLEVRRRRFATASCSQCG